jgi:very-short-patch-repair endonuclease
MRPMRDETLRSAQGLLRCQGGVLTRAQALDAGLTDRAIAVRLHSGRWQRLHTGVYATFSGEPPRDSRLWAAVLRAGPGAALSHQTAAELYGLTVPGNRLTVPTPMIHVTVPSGSPVTRPVGTVVRYSGRLDQTRHPVLTPPRTRIEDSVLDLIEICGSMDEAVSLILRANASRRTTPERILAAMLRRPRMPRRTALLQALGAAEEGAHSLLEFRYITRVERPHGLPSPRRQNPVRRSGRSQYQDLSYDDYALVVELDGREAHPEWFRWADIRRDNANAATGQVTLRYGWDDVTERPCRTALEIAATLREHSWTGTLRRCGSRCLVRRPTGQREQAGMSGTNAGAV